MFALLEMRESATIRRLSPPIRFSMPGSGPLLALNGNPVPPHETSANGAKQASARTADDPEADISTLDLERSRQDVSYRETRHYRRAGKGALSQVVSLWAKRNLALEKRPAMTS